MNENTVKCSTGCLLYKNMRRNLNLEASWQQMHRSGIYASNVRRLTKMWKFLSKKSSNRLGMN